MAEVSAPHRPSGFAARALRHPSFLAGGALTGLLVAMGVVSLLWTPGSPTRIVIRERLLPPGPEHWLGTDLFGWLDGRHGFFALVRDPGAGKFHGWHAAGILGRGTAWRKCARTSAVIRSGLLTPTQPG